MRSPLLPYLWMLLGALAFAVMAVLTSELREEFRWQWIALARSALAMLFAASLVIAGGAKFVFLRPRTLWMRSLAGSVSLLCGFYAMTHYEVSVVLTLTNMYPLWVAVLSWPLLGEWPKGDVWLAAAIGVIGVCVLSYGSAVQPGAITAAGAGSVPASSPLASQIAIGASLVSAFTSSIALIGLHRLQGIDSRAVVTHFSAVSAALCAVALFLLPYDVQPAASAGQNSLFAPLVMLVGVGLFATIGQLFLTKAFAAGSPARVSVVGLSQTAFTMLMEMVLHQKRFHPLTLVGMVLIIAPTAWVLLRGRAVAAVAEDQI